MTFSQGWDTGFKSIMIYIGVVFFWLCFIERYFSSQSFSVLFMNIAAAVLAVGFLIRTRKSYITERVAAQAEIAALMSEVE